jgi:hypothetical protein
MPRLWLRVITQDCEGLRAMSWSAELVANRMDGPSTAASGKPTKQLEGYANILGIRAL